MPVSKKFTPGNPLIFLYHPGNLLSSHLALYPAFTDGGKNAWFQSFMHARNFPRNLGNRIILVFFRVWITHNRVILVFFHVMATCSDSDDEFSSALVLHIIYTDEGYSDWKPGRNDRVVIVLLLLCDAAQ